MKSYLVVSRVGINEVVSSEMLGLEGNEEWEEVEVESNIISKYEMWEDVGRIWVEDEVCEKEMLEELGMLDEEIWG